MVLEKDKRPDIEVLLRLLSDPAACSGPGSVPAALY